MKMLRRHQMGRYYSHRRVLPSVFKISVPVKLDLQVPRTASAVEQGPDLLSPAPFLL